QLSTRVQPDQPAAMPGCGRDPLIAAITAFLARDHAPALGAIRESLQREIDGAGPEALASLGRRLLMDSIGLAIAALLPPTNRRAYTTDPRATLIQHPRG
ncbi:MAG TPA: hypothetical protein VF921_12755, partial [Vicinamibacterales bacterium]